MGPSDDQGNRIREQGAPSGAADAAKLEALKAAAQVGLDDLAAGRYIDIEDSELDDYIAELGRHAAALAE